MSVAWRSSSHAPLNVVDLIHYIASRSNANMSWISLEIPPGIRCGRASAKLAAKIIKYTSGFTLYLSGKD